MTMLTPFQLIYLPTGCFFFRDRPDFTMMIVFLFFCVVCIICICIFNFAYATDSTLFSYTTVEQVRCACTCHFVNCYHLVSIRHQ